MDMRQLSCSVVLLCLIAFLYADVFTVKCQPNTTIFSYYCSYNVYDRTGAYAAEIDYGLDELSFNTIDQPNFQYTLTGTYASGFAYCQPQLYPQPIDCISCLEDAADYLRSECTYSVTAFVAMVDCGMRYDPISQ